MKINELTTGQGNVDVQGTIKEVGEPRTFNRFGRELVVVNAILEDDSGNIKLTLWNEDANKFKQGEVVKITNGYVNEFQGEAQLTAGKFGKMEKVGEGEASADSGQAELSDNVAESIGEDVAEDSSVEEAVKEEAPEGTSEEQVEEASESVEEAEDAVESEGENSEEAVI